MRHIAGKPVFLHNSTFPHKAAGHLRPLHRAAAHERRALRARPHRHPLRVRIRRRAQGGMPHGASTVTFIDPEYATGRWVGIKGTVEDNPFYDICRSQQDVRIQGNWRRLLKEVRDSHWVMAYGDHLRELAYAASRIGVQWEAIT